MVAIAFEQPLFSNLNKMIAIPFAQKAIFNCLKIELYE